MSIGKGLGQQTGGDANADKNEGITLLNMVKGFETPVGDWGKYCVLTEWEYKFLISMRHRLFVMSETKFFITGKELFKLRDIKDKLFDKGAL